MRHTDGGVGRCEGDVIWGGGGGRRIVGRVLRGLWKNFRVGYERWWN